MFGKNNKYLCTQVKFKIHLLDLKRIIEKITVVKKFKARCEGSGDRGRFERIYEEFLHKLCSHCALSITDVYFEDVPFIVRNSLYIEVTNYRKPEIR